MLGFNPCRSFLVSEELGCLFPKGLAGAFCWITLVLYRLCEKRDWLWGGNLLHFYKPKSQVRWRQREKKVMSDQNTEGTCQKVTFTWDHFMFLLILSTKNIWKPQAFLSGVLIVIVSFCSVLNRELTFTSWPIFYAHWVHALKDNWMKCEFQTKTNTFPTCKCRVVFPSLYSG